MLAGHQDLFKKRIENTKNHVSFQNRETMDVNPAHYSPVIAASNHLMMNNVFDKLVRILF